LNKPEPLCPCSHPLLSRGKSNPFNHLVDVALVLHNFIKDHPSLKRRGRGDFGSRLCPSGTLTTVPSCSSGLNGRPSRTTKLLEYLLLLPTATPHINPFLR